MNGLEEKYGKSFCVAPWTHIFFKPTGVVHPCCMSQTELGKLDGQSLFSAWNSDEYKELRLKFLKGEAPKGCEACYGLDRAGARSMRSKLNAAHAKEITFVEGTDAQGGVDRLNLKYLDIRWSNLCNFRCRSCSVEWSSSWLPDAQALGAEPDDARKVLAPQVNWKEIETQILPFVESICFAGGEPLIQENTYKILRTLIQLKRTDVKLSFVTNLSHYGSKNENLFELLRHFSQVDITASADGTEDRYEYLRKGGDWDLFSHNFKAMAQLLRERQVRSDKLQIYFSTFWINAFHAAQAIPAMEDEFQTKVTANLSTSPDFSRLDYLPEFVKTAIRDHYGGTTHPELLKILQFMNGIDLPYAKSIRHFRNYIIYSGQLDRLRGEFFLKVFPEWIPFLRPEMDQFLPRAEDGE